MNLKAAFPEHFTEIKPLLKSAHRSGRLEDAGCCSFSIFLSGHSGGPLVCQRERVGYYCRTSVVLVRVHGLAAHPQCTVPSVAETVVVPLRFPTRSGIQPIEKQTTEARNPVLRA